MRITSLLTLALVLSFHLLSPADQIPDIQDLPLLKAGLPSGTIAIAFPDQLHPTQPQTGHRELEKYKIPAFKDLVKDDGKKFSKKMYQFSYQKSLVPVYLHSPTQGDSRQGIIDTLGFATDRTHGSDAQSQVYQELYGKSGLRKLIFDEKGRPLNFIIVKVIEDLSNLPDSNFAKFLVNQKHVYLKEWSRGTHGETIIQDISFYDLPEKVYQTSDNPFRSLISELQHSYDKDEEPYLERRKTDYAQFYEAEKLAQSGLVTWDEIDNRSSSKVYEKALEVARKFFRSEPLPHLCAKVIK